MVACVASCRLIISLMEYADDERTRSEGGHTGEWTVKHDASRNHAVSHVIRVANDSSNNSNSISNTYDPSATPTHIALDRLGKSASEEDVEKEGAFSFDDTHRSSGVRRVNSQGRSIPGILIVTESSTVVEK